MPYSEFVERVAAQDSRNVFSEYAGELDKCAERAAAFYRHYNPADVEFEYDGAVVRMFSAEELGDAQRQYAYLDADMVFASCNGDPIFIKADAVYTCPHGTSSPRLEKLADSFEDYLYRITNKLKGECL